MNRRQMFARLLGGAAVPAVMYQPPSQPERPVSMVSPYCPKCGLALEFFGPKYFEPPDTMMAVDCQCGWHGWCPLYHRIP